MFWIVAALTSMVIAVIEGDQSIAANQPASGLRPGEQVEPWNPIHVAGPDQGTNTCPVCVYGERPVVVAFAKNTNNTAALVARLELLARQHRKDGLRIVVAVVDADADRITALADNLRLTEVSLCYPTLK